VPQVGGVACSTFTMHNADCGVQPTAEPESVGMAHSDDNGRASWASQAHAPPQCVRKKDATHSLLSLVHEYSDI